MATEGMANSNLFSVSQRKSLQNNRKRLSKIKMRDFGKRVASALIELQMVWILVLQFFGVSCFCSCSQKLSLFSLFLVLLIISQLINQINIIKPRSSLFDFVIVLLLNLVQVSHLVRNYLAKLFYFELDLEK